MTGQKRPYPLLANDVARARICVAISLPVILAIIFALRELQLVTVLFSFASVFVTWSVICLVYIVLTLVAYLRADAGTLGQWLRATPRPTTPAQRISWAISGYGAVWWALNGGAISILAMVLLVTTGERTPVPLIWAGVVVLSASWALIAVSFALHYAREQATRGGFEFPGEEPVFTDFIYLSLQLSTTFAGSDVTITTTRARRYAALHGGMAFLFNTVIIAILVTVMLSVVSS
ncbi:DUF1345 domain-containing protein [Nonomuraea sp. NPDC050404]|uniref:DUF1345 domain-containing protein n=1 Tax=Nonomuraea sp. NPDC050404 TaxID=3155783 RepID=UPI0033FDE5BA